jgi:hypothetical protein
MTRADILALKAGRSLNVCVAEKIMGNKVVSDPIMGDTELLPQIRANWYTAS